MHAAGDVRTEDVSDPTLERPTDALVPITTSCRPRVALWVTPKAIDFHLKNVFDKLGITSRRELRGRSFS